MLRLVVPQECVGVYSVGRFMETDQRALKTCRFMSDGNRPCLMETDQNIEKKFRHVKLLVHPNILSHHSFPQVAHSGSVIILFV